MTTIGAKSRSYTVRYPEFKTTNATWGIRSSGLYHQINEKNAQSVIVLLSPTPDSAAYLKIQDLLRQPQIVEQNPYWVHPELIGTHSPAWRLYINSLESRLLPMVNRTSATFIDEALRVGYDNLSELVGISNRFLQVPTVLYHGNDVLDELLTLSSGPASSPLERYRRRAIADTRTATYLQQRAQTTAQLVSDTLSFRDQIVAKEQNGNMLRLNKSAVFLTTLTLLYLPASFVASFFGTNFFDLDKDDNGRARIISTSMIWIYVVSSIALTAITFVSYAWLLRNDSPVLSSMSPKVRLVDWQGLTKRPTTKGEKGGSLV
ncbi:hypothetical protein BJ170DRAFT_633987 [Xylariales sp. AK1849]|nr:hypothetical protein BJ170DRAFT_633987 [Xylariales sp. AK1849]